MRAFCVLRIVALGLPLALDLVVGLAFLVGLALVFVALTFSCFAWSAIKRATCVSVNTEEGTESGAFEEEYMRNDDGFSAYLSAFSNTRDGHS